MDEVGSSARPGPLGLSGAHTKATHLLSATARPPRSILEQTEEETGRSKGQDREDISSEPGKHPRVRASLWLEAGGTGGVGLRSE